MSAKLNAKLPTGEANGLAAVGRELVETPEKIHVAIVLIDTKKIEHDVDSGDVIPVARIRRLEVIKDPEDGKRMRMLLRREFERRTGRLVLPFEMQEEMEKAFGPEVPDDQP